MLRTEPETGGWNMALDQALLERARRSGEGVWRCYAWSSPTVSFGRNESVAGRFDAASVSRAHLVAVRRPTGGRALLHGREVTYSATLPLDASIGWRDAYAEINQILLDALRALGVHATLCTAASSPAVRPDGPLCFEAPAVGEIAVGDAKLVGSAIWRERGAYLQHGSILLHDDQRVLFDAALPAGTLTEHDAKRNDANDADTDDDTDSATDARSYASIDGGRSSSPSSLRGSRARQTLNVPPPAASLGALFAADGRPAPAWSDVADALEAALSARADTSSIPLDDALVAATERSAAHFTSDAWLWRR